MTDGTRITVDDNGYVRELPDWQAWRQAIGSGFLVPPRPVTVYRPGMPPQTMPAGAVPELQPLFAERAGPGASSGPGPGGWQGGPGGAAGAAMAGRQPPPYQGSYAGPPPSGGGAGKVIFGVLAGILLLGVIAVGAVVYAIKRHTPAVATSSNVTDTASNVTAAETPAAAGATTASGNSSAAEPEGPGEKGDGSATTTTTSDTTAGEGGSGFQATYRTQFVQRCTAAVPQSQSDAAGLDMPTICACAADKLLASQTQEQLAAGPSSAAQATVTQECLQEHPPRQ
ncbi:hypothetical protein [Sphingomonas sp.]|uniref:hypothetical protein n=1 Tax=Sphingomonas sp. TaxID=28214 RepID=UPI003CC5B9F9